MRKSPTSDLPAQAARRGWGRLIVSVVIVGYAACLIIYLVLNALPGDDMPATPSAWLALVTTFEPILLIPLLPLLLLALILRIRIPLALLALASVPFFLFYAPLFLPRLPQPPAQHTLKLMTHNILAANQMGGAKLAEAILAENADVVALQELIEGHAAQLGPRLSAAYPYRVIYSSQGLGLYSRYPLRNAELLTLAAERSYAIRATLDAPGGPITVFNAHPRNPRINWNLGEGDLMAVADFDPTRRDRAVVALAEAVERVPGPVIVLGDLNLTDRTGAYRQLTKRLIDSHREAGWGLGYTFPDTRPAGRTGFPWPILRIDYVLHSDELRTLDSDVGPTAGSDHRPVIARLALPG